MVSLISSRRSPGPNQLAKPSSPYHKHARSQLISFRLSFPAIAVIISCIIICAFAVISTTGQTSSFRSSLTTDQAQGTTVSAWNKATSWGNWGGVAIHGGRGRAAGKTLVLYVYSNTDPQYFANLVHFVRHGMPGCDECDYYVTVNQDEGTEVRNPSPSRLVVLFLPKPQACSSDQ